MTLEKVYSPYAMWGLEEDMVYGPNFTVHLVLKRSMSRGVLFVEVSQLLGPSNSGSYQVLIFGHSHLVTGCSGLQLHRCCALLRRSDTAGGSEELERLLKASMAREAAVA